MHEIKPIPALQDNYIWAIIDTISQACLIIDPGEATPVIHFLNTHQLSLEAILLTHHHLDHTGGVVDLIAQHPCPVYGPETLALCTHTVKEGDLLTFNALALSFNLWETPGHTLDHIVFYNDQWLFSGDTLFAAGCGRLFEGTPTQMVDSLNKIKTLPDHTKVYCAHEYTLNNLKFAHTIEPNNQAIKKRLASCENSACTLPSTMALEKDTNPFLRCDRLEIQSEFKIFDEIQLFKKIRQQKDAI